MSHWKQNFDYKFAGAYELQPGEEKIVTILRTATEDVIGSDGKKQQCFVAYFKESSKPMVLNKTNCKTIEKLYGAFVENWVGKRIVINAQRVKAFGDVVDALRVKMVKPADPSVTFKAAEDKLKACKTLDELQKVYLALTADEKTATNPLKDQLKSTLK